MQNYANRLCLCVGLRFARISITRLRVNKVIVKEVIQRVECGPFLWIFMPTLEHDCIIGIGTYAWWFGHSIVVLFHFVDYLRMCHARIWIGAECDEFVEQDAKRPHVRFDCVRA